MSNLNLNKVVLAGRLTGDPELKQTQSQISVTSFGLAINRRIVKEGEQPQADFINIVAWRQTAEFICKYFRKGSPICVTGSIQTRNWTDQQNVKHYATEVVVDEAMFVDSKSESGSVPAPAPSPAPAPAPQAAPTVSVPEAYGGARQQRFDELGSDDDLPF